MRALFGHGTPKEAASDGSAILFAVQTGSDLAIAIVSAIDGETPTLVIITPETA
ncbi:MAG: hypothetical protein WAU78_01680 [Roseiarcus sp.]|jgi:hypothetical protein